MKWPYKKAANPKNPAIENHNKKKRHNHTAIAAKYALLPVSSEPSLPWLATSSAKNTCTSDHHLATPSSGILVQVNN
ncbi:hypothetical protein [Snodgrassella alvi]|uniref:hypothetical protein n=1 Tax=Snodgrassella alvi TaxID=1196083 RepID=UPI0011838E71|nr:hypothetical protein [Snodgrassella alvi]